MHSIHFITFNNAGLLMAVASFLISLVVCKLSGATNGAMVMFTMGAPALLFDVTFRLRSRNGHWIVPTRGGMVMHIPIWIWGCLCIGAAVWCAVYESAVSK